MCCWPSRGACPSSSSSSVSAPGSRSGAASSAGVTLGILGFGSIGAEVARLLAPFGARILATPPPPDRGPGDANVELLGLDGLDELFRASDVVCS